MKTRPTPDDWKDELTLAREWMAEKEYRGEEVLEAFMVGFKKGHDRALDSQYRMDSAIERMISRLNYYSQKGGESK